MSRVSGFWVLVSGFVNYHFHNLVNNQNQKRGTRNQKPKTRNPANASLFPSLLHQHLAKLQAIARRIPKGRYAHDAGNLMRISFEFCAFG